MVSLLPLGESCTSRWVSAGRGPVRRDSPVSSGIVRMPSMLASGAAAIAGTVRSLLWPFSSFKWPKNNQRVLFEVVPWKFSTFHMKLHYETLKFRNRKPVCG